MSESVVVSSSLRAKSVLGRERRWLFFRCLLMVLSEDMLTFLVLTLMRMIFTIILLGPVLALNLVYLRRMFIKKTLYHCRALSQVLCFTLEQIIGATRRTGLFSPSCRCGPSFITLSFDVQEETSRFRRAHDFMSKNPHSLYLRIILEFFKGLKWLSTIIVKS